ncbi:MAG TPA: hypothetical protein VFZ40_16650 [Pyrinomonadaceae bacterium]
MKLGASLLIVFLGNFAIANPSVVPTSPFDRFGDINCEDEMARLDNFALQLQNEPHSKGAILFYAGRMAADQLPRRGEAEARVSRIKSYLFKRRGVPSDRITFISGGYGKYFLVQLWMVPPGAALPDPEPHLLEKVIRFRKGKLQPRDFRCQI